MEISANFAFLKQEFPHVAESASYAERLVYSDPRAACFRARHALEQLVKRVYKVDNTLNPPRVANLDGYLGEPAFIELVPEVVWQKAELIRKAGNNAVHGVKMPTPEMALDIVGELFHVLYWAGRNYLRQGAERLRGKTFDESLVPRVALDPTPASVAELEALKAERDAADEARKTAEGELETLREQIAAIKTENEAVPETHDWNEEETRRNLIDFALHRAGWPLDQERDREFEVQGMPNDKGIGYADYVLWGDDGKPLAIVEAKRSSVEPKVGQQQAKLYADCLEQMFDQRPIIFYTNGYQTWLWDDTMYPERRVAGFYKKQELATLIRRRTQRRALATAMINDEIAGRYYQKRAIKSIGEHFTRSHRRALLVMATGTGKTRTAIALVDQLQRAGWIKRALFLADRVSLVRQAVNAFKAHLPESSPVNLVTEKDKEGRVYGCTYPTMMGLIDESNGNEARFGVGHFDLIIIDEAHRSVYQKYGAIFRYFDSLLVGLTATPREQVDKNTYSLFGLESGSPTDAYELERAIQDEFLVPPAVQQVDLKFPREGINYDELSDEEKEQWEGLDWGDETDPAEIPDRVNSSAINNWLFNESTVDLVLKHVMKEGHKVDGGDRLAKTIFFVRNHKHAQFIEERFNHHYPHYAGHFARVIDNYAKYPQSLIDDFMLKEKSPHLAISVDMLDTGIDVPEVANLVFFKPVYSKIKFWQMIGRGTRLCPELFGPGDDKADFRVFDFCFNFDFFRENPDGIEAYGAVPLSARVFRARVELLKQVQSGRHATDVLPSSLAEELHAEVCAMNTDNFIVREELESVQRYQRQESWTALSDAAVNELTRNVAVLPTEREHGEIEARLFDLTALNMQLAHANGDTSGFEGHRLRVVEIAALLEEKTAIPAVKAALGYLQMIQELSFWEGITLDLLEELRLRIRDLTPLLDKKSRKVVYTDFQDEVMAVREAGVIDLPRMTSAQYAKKVQQFLRGHLDHIAVQRLRMNQPLTEADLKGLERALVEIGEDDGETLLRNLLERSEAPSLPYFVRRIVGMDRAAAQAAFSEFLSDRRLTAGQVRFIEMVIDQLTANGVVEHSVLYSAPFSLIHAEGPDALFKDNGKVLDGVFSRLEAIRADLSG